MKLDHFYIKVQDLDKAIDFYEAVLGMKIKSREGDRWADFKGEKDSIYFGILNTEIDGETPTYGDNVTPTLKTKDIEKSHRKVSQLKPKTLTKIFTITQPAKYRYFQFEDPWDNVWEVAEYDY